MNKQIIRQELIDRATELGITVNKFWTNRRIRRAISERMAERQRQRDIGIGLEERKAISQVICGGAEKPKRQARVLYRRTSDGKNLIVGLEGFLSSDEIRAISPEVHRIWQRHDKWMYASNGAVRTYNLPEVKVGNIYKDADFTQLIAQMKTCGRVLSQIIRDVAEAEKAEAKLITI